MRLRAPHWLIPAASAMGQVSEGGYVRAFNEGANLATINLTPRAVRSDFPIYKRDGVIMDEERVLSAIEEAGLRRHCRALANHSETTLMKRVIIFAQETRKGSPGDPLGGDRRPAFGK
jgi:hypothetical protein